MKLPVIGSFNTADSINVDSQRTVNWYLEKTPAGRNKAALYPTPGSTLFTTAGTGHIRGTIEFGGYLYVVSGQDFYQIDTSGNAINKGSLATSGSSVSMAASATELFIVDGTNGYIFTSAGDLIRVDNVDTGSTTGTIANGLLDSGATFITLGVTVGTRVYNDTDSTTAIVTDVVSETTLTLDSNVFTTGESYTIGDVNFPNGADQVVFAEGYFIVNDPNKDQGLNIDGSFFWSDLRDGTSWTGTSFATAERDEDKLIAIEKNAREIWLFGETSTEIWYNSGGDPVFTPVSSGYSEWGCSARDSVSRVDQSLMWLSKNKNGQGLVVQATGFVPKVVSSPALNSAIASYDTISDASAFTMQWKGHTWYVLTFPSEKVTWVYDLSEQVWFEWNSWQLGRSRYATHTLFNNSHYMGDYLTGSIYKLDNTTKRENGNIVERVRKTSHFYSDKASLFHNLMELEFEYGVGGANDAQVMLRWSDDYGHTWSQEYWKPLGKTGEYKKRLRWKRLGSSRDRVYEIRITDECLPTLIAGYIQAKESSRET